MSCTLVVYHIPLSSPDSRRSNHGSRGAADADHEHIVEEGSAEAFIPYPSEVMEIVLAMGCWKMYNTMHTAMGVPLEDPVLAEASWVDVAPHSKG